MKALPGIGSHHSARRLSDEWLTPKHVLDALGPFDLDPCSPVDRPWPTAKVHLTIHDDGLSTPWPADWRVFANPPYSDVAPWMEKMALHDRGIALVFARTEVAWFQRWVWPHASGLLFLAGRLTFIRGDGKPAVSNSGAPSVLIAYGARDADRLYNCGLPGAFVSEPTMRP